MYEDETQWFSQTLMTYKDSQYASDGYLRLSISTNTKDFLSFSPTNFGLSISNGMTKVCNMNIQNATDLLLSLKNVINNPNSFYESEGQQILKKYNQNQNLVFEFILEVNNNERVVRITIRNSETDFAKIVIPYLTFFVMTNRLKEYVKRYENICLSLPNNFLLKELLLSNRRISPAIKSLPSKFMENESSEPEVEVNNEEVKNTEMTINDLDTFIGGSEMNNVDIPDLNSKKIVENNSTPKSHKINSKFVENVLKNDLHNLTDLLNVAETNPAPIKFLEDRLHSDLGYGDSYKVLHGIDDISYKSLLYCSKTIANTIVMGYVEQDQPISSSVPVLKFKTNESTEDNLELAYDLLMINSYLRIFRRKIESKISDAYKNGAINYLLFRCYMDCMCFSFLEEKEIPVIISSVVARFNYYNESGFFDKFKKVLEDHNCIQTSSDEISFTIEDLCKKVINASPFITNFHDKLFNNKSLLLPSNNTYKIEQIINEVVPLEIYSKLGKDIHDKDLTSISSEVLNLFENKDKQDSQKSQKKKNKKRTETNIQRFIRSFRNEIPDKYKDEFNVEIDKLSTDKKYDFEAGKFPLEEFGDNIVKGLYIWDPENDPKVVNNYKYFYEKYENEIMTKDNILSSINQPDAESSQVDDWSSPFDNLDF